MPYNGQLNQNVNYKFRIADAAGGVAATFLTLNRRDKIASAEPETVPAGASKEFPQLFGDRIDRLVLFLTLANPAGQVTVTVLDGTGATVQPPVTLTGDQTVVWDTSVL